MPSGPLQITAANLLTALAPLSILIAYIILRRAVKSKGFFDDFFALVLFFVVVQVVIGIGVAAKIIPSERREILIAALMTVIVYQLSMHAGAKQDSKFFFHGLVQVYLIWALVLPQQVVQATLDAMERFARLASSFWPSPPPFLQAVAALAGFFALGQLYGVGTKPKPPIGPMLDALKDKIEEELDAIKKKAQ